ncbi:hypothetical protein Prum_016940 [Phytohabitans rumicis]|uniref:Uncharacterized protein n=1 Tax=Phytohabitans rumicis TaxID=1076125 RepID=A0A6V8KSD7_9ACTN|nr:hypothetical protein Prum_016940 [Phytohabitans rumicis]
MAPGAVPLPPASANCFASAAWSTARHAAISEPSATSSASTATPRATSVIRDRPPGGAGGTEKGTAGDDSGADRIGGGAGGGGGVARPCGGAGGNGGYAPGGDIGAVGIIAGGRGGGTGEFGSGAVTAHLSQTNAAPTVAFPSTIE